MPVSSETPNDPLAPEDLATYGEEGGDRDRLRLEIGDTDVSPDSDALFLDSELDIFLAEASDVLAASALACVVLANRYARQFDFAEDGQSFALSQRASHYMVLAKELRNRSGGASSVPLVSSTNAAIGDNLPSYGVE